MKKAKIFFGLATGFLLLVICSPFFATIGFADDIDTVQTINSGTLSFVDIPENFSFDSLAASDESQASSYVPTEGASSTGDIIVQDLRFSGGFSLTVQATAFENEFNDAFECADFAFLTFNSADAEGVEESANIIPGTAAVTAPYNGDPLRDTYTAMTPTGDDATVCEPVEILSANTESDQGRIGSWKLYPTYQLTVPPFAPPGTYASSITFTLVDDTTAPSPFGDGFAITSSTPASGQVVYYQSGSDDTSFIPAYSVPSYSGVAQVDIGFDICDSSDFDNCYDASYENIYGDISPDGGGGAFRFNEDYVRNAVTFLGLNSGSTIYFRMRLVEQGGETIASDNYYTFVATEDPVDGPTDDWDSGDDVVGAANDLGAPTVGVQTHGPHTLSDADYYDWFAFDLTDGETYNFAGVTGTGDTAAWLYDGENAPLDEDNDSGEDLMFSLDYTATSTSTHYLAVRCSLIATDCGYTLSYADTSDSGGDEWDAGDDTGAGSTALGAPTAVAQTHGPHTLSATDNYDWFSVNLTSGNQYIFEATSGSGDTYGQLYSDNGGITQVASDDDSAGSLMFRVTYTPSSDGTYYFRTRCFTVGNDCGYTLQYSYAGR